MKIHRQFSATTSLLACLVLAGLLPAQLPFASPIRRVTFTPQAGNLDSRVEEVRVSDDGRRIVFATAAQNVGVGTPTPGRSDLYLHDTVTGQLTALGIDLGTRTMDRIHIAADARFVLFGGSAQNGGFAGPPQVWLRDTTTGALELISRNGAGTPANGTSSAQGISADGRYVLFLSDASDLVGGSSLGPTLYRLDRQDGSLRNVIVDQAGVERGATSPAATMSANARFVAFTSSHPDLVPGDTNGRQDGFVRDLLLGVTERLTIRTDGSEVSGATRPAAISADGRFALFVGSAALDPALQTGGSVLLVRDRVLGVTRAVAISPFGFAPGGSDSLALPTPQFIDRTRVVVYATLTPMLSTTIPGPIGPYAQVFATDLDTGRTVMVSNAQGSEANANSNFPAVSTNGRQIVFVSRASNLDPSSLAPSAAVDEVFHTSLDCAASSVAFGAGSPGTGGIVPLLFGTDADCNSAVHLLAGGTLGGAPMVLLFGEPAVSSIPFLGIGFHVDIARTFAALAVPNGGLPGVPGAGSWFAQLPVAALNDTTIAMQVLCLDAGAASGLSASNGVAVQVH